jgi:hypothetical protein
MWEPRGRMTSASRGRVRTEGLRSRQRADQSLAVLNSGIIAAIYRHWAYSPAMTLKRRARSKGFEPLSSTKLNTSTKIAR